MFRIAFLCLVVCFSLTAPSFAADAPAANTVTLTVDNVKSAAGMVVASLCGDPKAAFPGACTTYVARAPAQIGSVVLTFKDVTPGAYAIQVFQDENGNGRLDFPAEGYAFGNDMAFPPSFAGASITVAGDTAAHVNLVHLFSPGASAAGTSGAPAPAGVIKSDLRANGLYGEFYVPAHTGPLPVIVMIGGSEGGLDTMSSMGVSFTKQGYAVLALAYWKEPGLAQTLEGIPLEYFDRAVTWLKSQPDIAPAHIGLVGWSRGAEAALLIASRNRDIRAVVAVSPSGIVWAGLNLANTGPGKPAWTVDGAPLPWVAPSPAGLQPGQPMTQMFSLSLPEAARRPETAIPVEKISGPVLLLSGSDDRLWPSNLMSEQIMARLRVHHFAFDYAHQNYDGAGHAVMMGDPALSAGRAAGIGLSAADLDVTNAFLGGSPEANAKARADSWARTLRFFDKNLKIAGPTASKTP